MDTNLLQTKSLSSETAYVWFFILMAPYGYVGKWKLQILYWFIFSGFLSILVPFIAGINGGNILEIIFPLLLFGIWPVNQFFAIPNKIKKYNLKIYEEMLKN